MNINAKTVPLGVVGWPVAHSISPELHNRLIEKLGLNYFYSAYPVQPGAMPKALDGMRALGIRGLNVTIPHKEEAFRLCDRLDAYAAGIGAVNTVVNENGCLRGYNTDAPGFIACLRREGVSTAGKRAALLGAGGAARAVAVGLLQNGVAELRIINRTRERAERLASELAARFPGRVRAAANADGVDLLVNATSVGMKNSETPFADFDRLGEGCVVCDIVYCPRETVFLKGAREAGLKTVGGIGMLVYQAALAFELFTGIAPGEEAVEELLRRVELKRSVALTGFMGCGKSAVGRELAQMCAAEFIDCDDYIVKKAGKPIPEIFAEVGEAGFRDMESRCIAELAGRSGAVIALGGGAVLRRENIDLLRESCRVVRIKTDVAKVLRNTAGDRSRPLLRGKTPEQVAELMALREPYYQNCDLTVDASKTDPRETAGIILDKIAEMS